MEENNRLETNTGSPDSGSMLYSAESQPPGTEESGHSAVYGTGSQADASGTEPVKTVPVQLTKPAVTEPSQPQQGTEPESAAPMMQPIQFGQRGQSPVSGPMQSVPPVQGAPAAKPKKNKSGLVVGILCAAAVVIVIAIGAMAAKSLFVGDPRTQLTKGIANMAKEMAQYQSSVAGDIGLVELNRLKDTEPVRTNIDLSFTDPEATGTFSSFDFGVDAVTDYKQKMAQYDVSLGTYGIDMQVGSIIAADNTVYLSVPILFQEDVYSLDLTNLGRDFNNSAWSALIEEKLPEDYALTLFGDRKESKEGELTEILNRHSSVTKDSMKFETIRQKREFSFGGTPAEYGGVRVTMNKDAYNESMEAVKNDILASDSYKAFMEGYQATYMGDFDEFKDDMDYVIEQLFGVRFEQDFVLDVYLDRKGRIVNISTPEDIAVSGQDIDIESVAVDVNFSGSERALDTIEGGIYVQSADEILYMGISRNAVVTKDHYSEDLTLRIQGEDTEDDITFQYANDWGYNDQTFDLRMSMDVPGTLMEISADGAYTDIVKGEGYTFRLNHGAVSIDGEDVLLLVGTIETETVDNTIKVPEDAINVLEMSEADIAGLFYGGLF